MKNRIGMLIGFIVGLAGFLFLFKVIFLNHIPPADELAPGIVVVASILSGLLFAYVGHLMQTYLSRKRS